MKIINSSLSASVIHNMRTKHRQIAYATYAKIQQDSRKENKFSQTLEKTISMVCDMSVRQSAARTTILIVHTLICSLDLDENLSEEALDEKNAEYLETFPRRPSAALVQLIHDRCGTQKELSLRSGISEATISRMCSDDNFRYDIRQITRIVISLHMPPLLSAAFMEQTGFGTAVMTRYLRYQCIIACMFMDELDDVINSNRKLFE